MNLTDEAINRLAWNCPSVQKLILYNCFKITDGCVTQVSKFCPQLREVDLSSCQNLTDSSIQRLVKGCPYLEVICCEECKLSELGITSIAENSYCLKTLKLAYCKGVTDYSLNKLANGCPNMSHVDLSYCTSVTVEGLKKAVGSWSNLKILNLRGLYQISTETVVHPNLQVLNLSWCKNIQDAAIAQIAAGCSSLVNLDLAWGGKITANAIHKLAQKLPMLRFLNLRGCTKVTFLTIKYLSGGSIMIYT